MRQFLFVLLVALAGCGIVSLPSHPTTLTNSMATHLVERYYDTCQEAMEIGQCAPIVTVQSSCSEPHCVYVVPAFQRWVRLRLVSTESTDSLGSSERAEALLRSSGVGRAFLWGTQLSSGFEVVGADWLYAPARVDVVRVMQHDNRATIVSRIAFDPDPAIVAYIQRFHGESVGGTPLETLAKAQGRTSTLHLTCVRGQWTIGDPSPVWHGIVFIGFAIFFILVLAVIGAFRDHTPIGAGAGPNIGSGSMAD